MSEDTISRRAAIEAIFNEPLCESGMKERTAIAVVLAIYEKINSLPSAQPEPCEDTISRQAAIDTATEYEKELREILGNENELVETVKILKHRIIALQPAQPDLSGYSDKLWKAAYERGRTEAQAEIVRCKDCKHSRFFDPCFYCYEFGEEINIPENGFCFMAERRTDEQTVSE